MEPSPLYTRPAPPLPSCPRCGAPRAVRTARRGPGGGERFWGCTRFPACRWTGPLDSPTPDQAATPAPEAGASARAAYGRKLEHHRRSVRRRRGEILLLGATIGFAGLTLWTQGGRIGPTYPFFGATLTLLSVVLTVSELYGVPDAIRAWGTGAEGEERTAEHLRELEPSGFIALHDRRMPGTRANIDHIVIGPPGLFVVESKSYAGSVSVYGDEVFVNSRRKPIVEQVRREATAVEAIVGPDLRSLELQIKPILCIHRATLPLLRSSVEGIPIVSGSGLVRYLRGRRAVLTADEVRQLADAIDRALPPAR